MQILTGYIRQSKHFLVHFSCLIVSKVLPASAVGLPGAAPSAASGWPTPEVIPSPP